MSRVVKALLFETLNTYISEYGQHAEWRKSAESKERGRGENLTCIYRSHNCKLRLHSTNQTELHSMCPASLGVLATLHHAAVEFHYQTNRSVTPF
jgi:hypothetical protein